MIDYKARRAQLLEGKQGPCMIAIFSGSAPMKSLDAAYPFYAGRNFFYLTGIEPVDGSLHRTTWSMSLQKEQQPAN